MNITAGKGGYKNKQLDCKHENIRNQIFLKMERVKMSDSEVMKSVGSKLFSFAIKSKRIDRFRDGVPQITDWYFANGCDDCGKEMK